MFSRFVKFHRGDEYEDLEGEVHTDMDITEPEMREIVGMGDGSECNTVPRGVFDTMQGNESEENKDSTEAVKGHNYLTRRGSYGTGKKARPLTLS